METGGGAHPRGTSDIEAAPVSAEGVGLGGDR